MCRGDELRLLLIGSELPQQRSVSMVPIQAQQVKERRREKQWRLLQVQFAPRRHAHHLI